MPHLRNQFSRTFKTDEYHYVTQIFPLPVNEHSDFGERATIMSDSTKRAYPDNLDYWTGTVGRKSTQYSKSSGGIKIKEYPGNNSSCGIRDGLSLIYPQFLTVLLLIRSQSTSIATQAPTLPPVSAF